MDYVHEGWCIVVMRQKKAPRLEDMATGRHAGTLHHFITPFIVFSHAGFKTHAPGGIECLEPFETTSSRSCKTTLTLPWALATKANLCKRPLTQKYQTQGKGKEGVNWHICILFLYNTTLNFGMEI